MLPPRPTWEYEVLKEPAWELGALLNKLWFLATESATDLTSLQTGISRAKPSVSIAVEAFKASQEDSVTPFSIDLTAKLATSLKRA